MQLKLVILDRDGVINFDSDEYIKNTDEWQPLPGSIEAIARLCHAGYDVVIATNQSGIGRGFYDHTELGRMHQKLSALLAAQGAKIRAVCYCPHTPEDKCECRKPKTGLYSRIRNIVDQNLREVVSIGDSYRDIQASVAVGCRPVLVLTGKGESTLEKNRENLNDVPVFPDLSSVVDAMLKNSL